MQRRMVFQRRNGHGHVTAEQFLAFGRMQAVLQEAFAMLVQVRPFVLTPNAGK